jgi:hypothetical protein
MNYGNRTQGLGLTYEEPELGLSGNLEDFDVAEIIQLIGRNRKTGELVVLRRAESRHDLRQGRRGVVSREDVGKALAAGANCGGSTNRASSAKRPLLPTSRSSRSAY